MIKEIYENGNISYIFWTETISRCLSKGIEHVDFDLVSEEGF